MGKGSWLRCTIELKMERQNERFLRFNKMEGSHRRTACLSDMWKEKYNNV